MALLHRSARSPDRVRLGACVKGQGLAQRVKAHDAVSVDQVARNHVVERSAPPHGNSCRPRPCSSAISSCAGLCAPTAAPHICQKGAVRPRTLPCRQRGRPASRASRYLRRAGAREGRRETHSRRSRQKRPTAPPRSRGRDISVLLLRAARRAANLFCPCEVLFPFEPGIFNLTRRLLCVHAARTPQHIVSIWGKTRPFKKIEIF